MNFQQAQQELLSQLRAIYEDREAATIADWVMEHITGQKKIDRILLKQTPVPAQQLDLLEKYTRELLSGRPIQYVLQESWFLGLKFYVDENVLIPRPETEELVAWVLEEISQMPHEPYRSPFTLLDVGTGSGCIPISLQLMLPTGSATVYACDVSREALDIAARNASDNQADIRFLQLDFLDRSQWESLPSIQILVSNPPYIPLRDKRNMAKNVVDFEPHLALFVANEDPLIFYQALADFARMKGLPGGSLYAEIHEELVKDLISLFQNNGFQSVMSLKDMHGKDRFIKATW